MVHRASLCILHCQQNVQILRIPRGKINWPTNLHHPLHPDLHSLYNGAASYSVTCSLPPTKEMNLKSNTKWNSRDLQNNLLIISYTIVPPVSYLFAHRRSYHLFFHISIFKCNYLLFNQFVFRIIREATISFLSFALKYIWFFSAFILSTSLFLSDLMIY